ncbi:MAG: Crp/Fnr family transcriptional regulator [Bacteroidales bacterium]|nr:Crp/Fnr family transcriptional regulator [Bacteroidales bacterium]
MASMFELLMELPLFRGVSHQRLSKTVGESKFHFLKYPAGETIIRAGSPCNHITFVISGSVRSTIENESGRFAVSQTLEAPTVITPEFLFGRTTEYPCTVEAIESTGILQIDKQDYLTILYSDQVFMFNYLNALAANAQKSMQGILSLTTGNIEERIAFWISALTQHDGRDITLSCAKRDLCSLFGVQRATFETAISRMAEMGIIGYHDNKELRITDRCALLRLLKHNPEDNE